MTCIPVIHKMLVVSRYVFMVENVLCVVDRCFSSPLFMLYC